MPRKVNVINLEPKVEVESEESSEIKFDFYDFTKIKNEVINHTDDDANEVVGVKKQPKKRATKKKKHSC